MNYYIPKSFAWACDSWAKGDTQKERSFRVAMFMLGYFAIYGEQ